ARHREDCQGRAHTPDAHAGSLLHVPRSPPGVAAATPGAGTHERACRQRRSRFVGRNWGAAGENVNLNFASRTARRIAVVADADPVVRLSTVTELAGKR